MSEEPETSELQEQESLIQPTPTEASEEPAAEEPSEEKAEEPEEPEAPEVVPLTADDITLPEALEVSDELRDEFLGLVNDQEISPKERAQALINLQEKALTASAETLSQQFDAQQKEWQDEVKADASLGGAKFQQHLANMGKLVEQFGSPELVEALASTGAGNNIHVHRFLAKMGETLLEGTPASGTPTSTEGDRASRMFPSMKG